MANDSAQHLVVPDTFRNVVLKLVHDVPQAGHPGRDKCLAAAHRQYYWPNMRFDTERHISQCLSSQNKGVTHKPDPVLEYLSPDGPWDTVAIDLLQLPRSQQGSSYVLVCDWSISRYVVLATLPNKSTEAVAHALVIDVICSFITAMVILSDNGTEFKSTTLKSHLSSVRYSTNLYCCLPSCFWWTCWTHEQKVLEILRYIVSPLQDALEDRLPQAAASINGSVNSPTGKASNYILFGSD